MRRDSAVAARIAVVAAVDVVVVVVAGDEAGRVSAACRKPVH